MTTPVVVRGVTNKAWAVGGGGSVAETDWVQITNAQMLGLAAWTAPIVLAAGGVGVLRMPIAFGIWLKTIVAAYTHAGGADFLEMLTLADADPIGPVAMDPVTLNNKPSGTYIQAGPGGVNSALPAGFVDNQDVILAMSGSNFGGGDVGNEVYIKVWYFEMTLP